MNYFLLGQSELFAGIEAGELENLLDCLQPVKKAYQKGEYVCRAGEPLRHMGFVLRGSVNIERNDAWGNQSLLGRVERALGASVTAVATGGNSSLVIPLCRRKFHLEPDLLLEGLRILYEKNTREGRT